MSRRASSAFSGGNSSEVSCTTSTAVPPLPECDKRPEDRVFGETDKELYGAVSRHHRLDEETSEASGGRERRHTREHRHCFLPDAFGLAEIDCNPADITLVRDVR